MKKTVFIGLITGLFLIFPAFSQNQILVSSKEAQKLLNAPGLLDNNEKKIDISEVYRCQDPYVSDALKGTYFVFSTTHELTDKSSGETIKTPVVYVENNNEHTIIDIFNVNDDIALLPLMEPKTVYDYEFVKFDSYGRIYISAINMVTQKAGIAVYFPGTKVTQFYPLPEYDMQVMDFEISDDGKYILVQSGLYDKVKKLNPDKSNVYVFYSDVPSYYATLFEFKKDHVSQIHYNSSDHSFYFLAYYEDDARETGAYIFTPQNGKKSRDCLNFLPAAGQGLDFFNFKNAVLVKDEASETFYATDYSEYKASPVYEFRCVENKMKLAVPVELEGLLLQGSTGNTDRELRNDPAGIYIHTVHDQVFSLDNKVLYSYKTQKDYEESLQKELFKRGKETRVSRLKTSSVRRFNIFLVVLILVLVAASILFIIFIHKIIRNRMGINPEQKLQIQEEEKAKISREIHDTVVQDLRAIRVQAESLPCSDSDKQKDLTEEISKLIVRMRNICYNLTPAEIQTAREGEDSGIELVSVIDTLCRQFYTKTNIPCSIQMEENFAIPSFDKKTSTHIIRVFQEILNNIEKHSYATKTSVLIRSKTEEEKKYLVIFVIDDGIGCDLKKMERQRRRNHFGIQNMKDRMRQIGGQIEFFSMPDQGMKVKLVIEIK